MPDIFLRTGQANPNDVVLTDPASIGLTVTVVGTQAAQTEAAAGLLTFKAASAAAQAAQTGTGTGREDFIASAAGSQGVQTESGAGRVAFRLVSAQSQAVQTGLATGRIDFEAAAAGSQAVQSEAGTGALRFVAAAAGSQAAQTEAAVAALTVVEAPVEAGPPRHGPPLGAAIVKGPAGNRTAKPLFLVVVGGRQKAQREQVALEHAENEDWLIFGEELAA